MRVEPVFATSVAAAWNKPQLDLERAGAWAEVAV